MVLVHMDDAESPHDVQIDNPYFHVEQGFLNVQINALLFFMLMMSANLLSNMLALFSSMKCSSFIRINVMITYNLLHSTNLRS